MSKSKRILSILLSAMVLLTMSGVGVFAADEIAAPAPEDQIAAEEPMDAAEGKDLNDATITVDYQVDWDYTGSAIEPEVTVKDGDKTLVKDTDYTVAYDKNIEVSTEGGEAEIDIKAVEGSGYTGTRKVKFIISAPETISLEDAVIEDIDDQVYDGTAKEPDVQITYDEEPLQEGVHYTVAYENNVELTTNPTTGETKMAKAIITAIEGSGFTGTVTEEFRIVDKLPDLGKIKNLEAMSGFESVTLTWDPVEGADTYLVMRTDQKWGSKKQGAYWPRDLYSLKSYKKKWDKISKHPMWENCNKGTVKIYKKYTYKVYAAKYVDGVTEPGPGQVKIGKQVYQVSKARTIKHKCVSKLRITCKVTAGTTLYARDGSHKSLTIHSGDKIVTDGYGAGCYYFTKKNARFRMNNARCYATDADYLRSKNSDYTKKEAEYFINHERLKYARPKSTSKNYFIWVSTYTQHVYAFKKSGNKWKCIRHWDCSSGDKNTPSPNGNKELWKKIRYRHSTDYWNCFSTLNALHGIKPASVAGYDWTRYLGQIKSGGCVRNRDENAGWIYHNVPTGTKIMVY